MRASGGSLGRAWRAATVAIAIGALTLPPSLAQTLVPYTVQVVALSDLEAATDIQTDLLRSGFPAYTVRSMSEQDDVFRVRVGAFADRNAALLYASGMPAVAGGMPVPAVAENIPAWIMPLAPLVVTDLDTRGLEVELARLPSGFALRLREAQAEAPGQAQYLLFVDGRLRSYRAWSLGVDEDGELVRVRELLLWPENWANDPDDVRAGFRNSLLALLAERLGVSVEELIAAEFRPEADGPPRLLVVERGPTTLLEGSELLGVGLPSPDMGESGPDEFLRSAAWPEEDELPTLVSELTLSELLASEAVVTGSGWQAEADGDFVRLTITDPEAAGAQGATMTGTSWRASLGRPLWSDGRYLVAALADRLLVYDFVVR